MKFAKNGLLLCGAFAVLALFATTALASSWIHYDYEYTWESYAYVNGHSIPGTWTVKTSYDYRWKNGDYHYKGHGDQRFVSADGTIHGHGVANFNFRQSDGLPRTNTRTYHLSFIEQGAGLVQRTKVTQHSTYNAHGEQTAFVYHYDW